jgi:hypothetical protein
MSYLAIFGHWENFIEDCIVRMLAGYRSGTYRPVLVNPPAEKSLTAARARLLGGAPYALWHDPVKSLNRVVRLVVGSPLERQLTANRAVLETYATIRHSVAHQSQDSRSNFTAASLSLTGTSFSSPGRLLRAQNHSDPLNPVRWIRVVSSDLLRTAYDATA